MVEIVKFPNPGKPGFQHLDIELGGDRFELIRRHGERKAVHHIAPGPKRGGVGSPPLRQSCHAPLESMAVQVGHGGNKDGVALVLGLRAAVRLHGPDDSTFHGDAHPAGPTGGQQSLVCENSRHACPPDPALGQLALASIRYMYIHNCSWRKRKSSWLERRMAAAASGAMHASPP